MGLMDYLDLLRLGAYASFFAVLGVVICLIMCGVAVSMLADIRRRLEAGAAVAPPPPPGNPYPPPGWAWPDPPPRPGHSMLDQLERHGEPRPSRRSDAA